MADSPTIFSGPMVQALLAGRKTQTRRIISRLAERGRVTEFGPSDTGGYDWHFRDRGMRWHDVRHTRLLELLPYRVGDRLWVKENFAALGDASVYRAGHAEAASSGPRVDERWRSCLFMLRARSRLTLIVETVRVERLQAISEADANAEGARKVYGEPFASDSAITDRRRFELLWSFIHGPDAWAVNPWVVAPTFRVVQANIDALDIAARAA